MIEEFQQISLALFGEPWSSSTIAYQVRYSNRFMLSVGQWNRHSLQAIDFINPVRRDCPNVAQ